MTRILVAEVDDLAVFGRDRGTGTVLPTTDLRRGDTYQHTALGFMVYTGTAWRQVETVTVADKAARDALATNYAAALHIDFAVWQTDTRQRFAYVGASKWHLAGGVVPHVTARRTTTINLALNTWTAYTWESVVAGETTDTTMWASATPTRLIAPIDGIYLLSGSIGFTGAAGTRYTAAKKNGLAMANLHRVTSGSISELPVIARFKLAAGEYAEVFYNTSVSGDSTGAFGEIQPRAELTWMGNI